jgi:hypothetical protein
MSRHQSAAAELAAYLRNSPDVGIGDLGGLNVRNAGDLGAATEQALEQTLHPVKAPTEHEEQCALFAWAAAHEAEYPALKLLFAVPNGGYRHAATAAALKAEGVKAGVPDIFLPVPRWDRFHGLWIELKRADRSNGPTEAQTWWIEQLRKQGYMAVVCYGAQEAIHVIRHYLL